MNRKLIVMLLLGVISFTKASSLEQKVSEGAIPTTPTEEVKPGEEIEEAGVTPEDDEETDDEFDVGDDEEEDAGEEKEEPTDPKEAGEEMPTTQPTEEKDVGEETDTEGDEKPTGESQSDSDSDDKEEVTGEEEFDSDSDDKEGEDTGDDEDKPAGMEVLKEDIGQMYDKEMKYESIKMGEKWFSLFHETDANNKTEYYMKLHYGKNAELTGGFKTDNLGNFIDELGNTLVSLKEINDFLKTHKFQDFWSQNKKPNALLIRKIIDFEEVGEPTPEKQLDEGEASACQCRSGCVRYSCNREQPIAVEKPLYYDNYVPTPCYKKKYVPYVVNKRCPVYIKKCVPVHVPVKIPIRVPVDVIVPCEQEYTKIIPVCKTIYKEVPRYIKRCKTVVTRVPKVCHVRVPEITHKTVLVYQPFKVIDRIKVHHHPAPCCAPAPCACSRCNKC